MIKIAVFISGRGSNLKAIIEAKKNEQLAFDIQCVVSNKKEAEGLKIAKENNISTVIVQPEQFESDAEYEQAIIKQLKTKRVEWVVLAGYMKIVGPTLLQEYHDHMINIHPSLLPAFKGLNAQRQAFEYGVKVAGCSVHFVNNEVDGGAVIDQEVVYVSHDESLESLTQKILEKEHQLYPRVLQKIATGKIIKKDNKTIVLD